MISTILLTTALAVSVSALPILPTSPLSNTSHPLVSRSFNIPITKRSNAGGNGKSMTPAARLSMLKNNAVRTCAKYGIPEIMGAGTHSKRDLPKGILQMGVAPSDVFYYGTIQVGTPPLAFEVSLDTGSSDLILAAPVCTEGCASDTPLYRTSYSSTSYSQNSPFLIQYQGGGASGVLVSDVVSFAGFTINDQTFGAITRSSTIVGQGGVSGLLGLAFRPLAASGALPFVQALWQNGQLPSPVFAFAFARYGASNPDVAPGGIITIGGVDGNFFSGAINYMPSPSQAYWQITLDNIVVGGKALGISATGVNIDTGTTNIYVPLNVANAIYNQIPGSVVAGGGIYIYPCKSTVSIGFQFGGIVYQLSASDLNIGYSDTGGQNCYGSIAAIGSAADGTPQYIIGDAFLKNVYSVFRFSPPAVGFAQLANPASFQQGQVPVGNAETIAQAGNNNNPPSVAFSAPAPAAPVVAAPVPVAVASGANSSPAPLVASSSPNPVTAIGPAPVVASPSTTLSGLADILQNALTSVIANSVRNAIISLNCRAPHTINKVPDLWVCV